jgi:hypothetical protein
MAAAAVIAVGAIMAPSTATAAPPPPPLPPQTTPLVDVEALEVVDLEVSRLRLVDKIKLWIAK